MFSVIKSNNPKTQIEYIGPNQAVMTLGNKESGGLTMFQFFPSVILLFNRIFTSLWPVSNGFPTRTLLLNYCIDGRCEMYLDSGKFCFVAPGNLFIGTQQARSDYKYPTEHYEGIELIFHLDMLDIEPYPLFQELGIDLKSLYESLKLKDNLYFAEESFDLHAIVSELWALRNSQDINGMKLLVAKLLLAVSKPEYQKNGNIRYLAPSQVRIAKETCAILCSDLKANYTAKELALRFQVSETTLKNYFRCVYGENISAYVRKKRMKQAAELLQTTDTPIADISIQVGYENPSKFAVVFKKQFGVTPLEYRRSKRLDDFE